MTAPYTVSESESFDDGAVLYIRTDADRKTGLGHFMRSLALAQTWQETGGRTVFIGNYATESVRKRIHAEGFEAYPIPPALSAGEDVRAVTGVMEDWRRISGAQLSREQRRSWVVIDGYRFDTDYQRRIQDSGHRTVVIDDNAHLNAYHADILVNQNIFAHRLHYPCDPETLLLLGSDYALLRREYRKIDCSSRSEKETVAVILLSFGGVDSKNQTGFTIGVLKDLDLPRNTLVRIVLGPENPRRTQIRDALKSAAFEHEILCDVPDMSTVMNGADLALTASGSTCWEFCFLGVPAIVTAISENQRMIAEILERMKIATSMGFWQDRAEKNLKDQIDRLIHDGPERNRMARRGMALIDGRGVHRVLDAMKLKGFGISVVEPAFRRAESKDSAQLYQLAMNPQMRQFSFHPDRFSFESHDYWYHRKLKTRDRSRFYVLECNGMVVAQARYDRIDGSTAEIDYSVHPAFQRKGLGATLLDRSVPAAGNALGVKRLRGIVFDSNLASQRCFEKAGFRKKADIMNRDIPCFLYERDIADNENEND